MCRPYVSCTSIAPTSLSIGASKRSRQRTARKSGFVQRWMRSVQQSRPQYLAMVDRRSTHALDLHHKNKDRRQAIFRPPLRIHALHKSCGVDVRYGRECCYGNASFEANKTTQLCRQPIACVVNRSRRQPIARGFARFGLVLLACATWPRSLGTPIALQVASRHLGARCDAPACAIWRFPERSFSVPLRQQVNQPLANHR